jgi:hypothetical protein
MARRPDFFLIGACRSGTSALFEVLQQHPGVFVPRVKEPHFFFSAQERTALARPQRRDLRGWGFQSPISDPHQYLALFAGAGEHQAVGEASTGYLGSPVAARRIRDSLPDAKLVAILRDPVERAHSHYWFDVMWDFEPAPTFEQSLVREDTQRNGCLPLLHFRHGLYHAHLSVYFELFPREQIRVYLYEDWRDSPGELLRDLFGFLGVDRGFTPSVRARNVTRAPRSRRLRRLALSGSLPGLARFDARHNLGPLPPMRGETRGWLRARYREDIEQLQALIGRDLSHWLEPAAVPVPSRSTLGVPGAVA